MTSVVVLMERKRDQQWTYFDCGITPSPHSLIVVGEGRAVIVASHLIVGVFHGLPRFLRAHLTAFALAEKTSSTFSHQLLSN